MTEWRAGPALATRRLFGAPGVPRLPGTVNTPAYATAFHNGVLIQNHFELKGETVFTGLPAYKAYDRAPIKLQSHGDPSEPISFRNIWVREIR